MWEKMVQLHTFNCHPLSGDELCQTAYSRFQAGSIKKKKDHIILCAESLLNIQLRISYCKYMVIFELS